MLDIGEIVKIDYQANKTILTCKTNKRILNNVLLYEMGGISTKPIIGNMAIIYRKTDWHIENQLMAFHIGNITKIKIKAGEVNIFKQISLAIASLLLSLQYNIDAHTATSNVYQALASSNLDALTKTTIANEKIILDIKILSLKNEKTTLQNIKTEIDKAFFE